TFSTTESERGEGVAVLSHRMWQQQFGADRTIPGRKIRIDERSVTVIGVMPQAFELPDPNAKLWLLLTADPRWPTFQLPRFRIADAFCALGRLKPGTSPAEARAEMAGI